MAFIPFSRRRMLTAIAAAGGAARLSPFLPTSAHAATAPKRILTIFHPMGYLEKSFWPTGAGANFTLGETMTALNPWKSKLIFMDGLSLYSNAYFMGLKDNEHGLGASMTFTGATYDEKGGAMGPSVEQAIADFQYAQAKTKFRALTLGVNVNEVGGHTAAFYRAARTPINPQSSAQATFDMLFNGADIPAAGPMSPPPVTKDPAIVDRLASRRQSVLNHVKGDLARVRALAGQEDKAKLDAHLDGISSLENRLKLANQSMSPSGGVAQPLAAPGSVTKGCTKPVIGGPSLQAAVHTQIDLITSAFACDMTRSVGLQLGICDGGMDAFEGEGIGQHDTTHKYSETDGLVDKYVVDHKRYDRWFADRWAYLLGRLDSIQEGDGTMLDNTLIVFSQDTSTNSGKGTPTGFGAHYGLRFPMFLAGGGNFAFKTGQYIKLPIPSSQPGDAAAMAKWVCHQRLLTSACQAFGMNVDTFGGSFDPGKGGVPGLVRV